MPVFPPRRKSWQFSLNQSAGGGFSSAPTLFAYMIKNTLKGFALNPWVVRGSSDAVTAGMDGVDRWDGIGKVVHRSTAIARSWVVLENASGMQMLLDLVGADISGFDLQFAQMYFSNAAGFTGGTITVRPTATDELPDDTTARVAFTAGGFFAWQRFHVMHSSDGLNTMVVGQNDVIGVVTMWLLGELVDPIAGWEHPNVVYIMDDGPPNPYNTGGMATLGAPSASWMEKPGGGWCFCYQMQEGCNYGLGPDLGSRNTVIDQLSAEWNVYPVGYYTEDPRAFGPLGMYPDLWAPSKAGFANGDMFPGDGSKQAILLGHYMFPWDGATTWITG